MQPHHADLSSNTEVGVMNNFERVQNVNTGKNQGMFNLGNLMIKTFTCISTGVIIQQVINQGVQKAQHDIDFNNIFFNSCGFGYSDYSSDNSGRKTWYMYILVLAMSL